jgi:HSP20 family protein
MIAMSLLPALLDRAVTRPESPVPSLIDGLFNDAFFAPLRAPAAFQPAADLSETDDEYIVRLEVPGLEPGDVTVEVLGDSLSIKGEKRDQHEAAAEGIRRVERRYGSFARTFRLGSSFDPESISAELKNGVLTVTLPKSEAAKPRRVEVKHEGSLAAAPAPKELASAGA